MRTGLPIATCLLVAAAVPAVGQTPSAAVAGAAASPPVITCTSLANLRTILRDAKDDPAAAVPAITDPKSDLGCGVLDHRTVTGVADHVALNGRAYDCLSLQGTSVCHWTVAGAAAPPKAGPATAGSSPAPQAPTKTRR